MVTFSIVDSYYTIVSMIKYGISGEKNPIALFLFNLGLAKLWIIVNAVLGFTVVVVFFLFIGYLQGSFKHLAISFFSLLLTIKVLISIYYICFFHFSFNPSLINLGILIFALIILVLAPRQEFINFFKKILNILNELILTFNLLNLKFKPKMKEYINIKQAKKNKGRLRNGRLWISLALAILCPFITLSLLQLFWKISKIQELPKWLKGLGIVTQMQGILYIAAFILILIMLTIMVYLIATIFEAFSKNED
jgi:hypothetical protein